MLSISFPHSNLQPGAYSGRGECLTTNLPPFFWDFFQFVRVFIEEIPSLPLPKLSHPYKTIPPPLPSSKNSWIRPCLQRLKEIKSKKNVFNSREAKYRFSRK